MDFANGSDRMKEKVKYRITKYSFKILEVEADVKEIIRILNNELDKEKKRDRTYFKHNISLEAYIESTQKEPSTLEPTVEEIVLSNLQSEAVRNAIDFLPPKQRETIIAVFYSEKSLRQIAKEQDIHVSTVAENFHAALKNLGQALVDIY